MRSLERHIHRDGKQDGGRREAGGWENGEFVFNGHGVSLLQDEKCAGDGRC